jgi:hypothetical protein
VPVLGPAPPAAPTQLVQQGFLSLSSDRSAWSYSTVLDPPKDAWVTDGRHPVRDYRESSLPSKRIGAPHSRRVTTVGATYAGEGAPRLSGPQDAYPFSQPASTSQPAQPPLCCRSNANSTAGQNNYVGPRLARDCCDLRVLALPTGRAVQKRPGPPAWVTDGRGPVRGYREPHLCPFLPASPICLVRHKENGLGVTAPVLGAAPPAVPGNRANTAGFYFPPPGSQHTHPVKGFAAVASLRSPLC